MIKEFELNNVKIKYDLQYKNVKNINLRIKSDGSIHVSANVNIPQKLIDDFLESKQYFILNAVEQMQKRSQKPNHMYYSENELKELILNICESVYPYYGARGINYPQIKFRKMVSRWGSCQPQKGILTFSTNLMYVTADCIEYVVHHEFTHFLQANHSAAFYEELEKVCPNWRTYRNKLKEI